MINAVTNVCLPGEINRKEREKLVDTLNSDPSEFFIFLFKEYSRKVQACPIADRKGNIQLRQRQQPDKKDLRGQGPSRNLRGERDRILPVRQRRTLVQDTRRL